MNASQERTEEKPASAPPHPDERARARRYLDLWERHLAHVAVQGSQAPARTAR